ncbi:uncharacterized protein LOC116851999 [Odontomachus brunneus]|uniref:uncharacterized protein LOC116851999 n=1 Tax=Odontomachus brunneus TaxID=486640 RepID=UPI0013F20629|nr:uncharacterized protein LOC116851999 [Odontomachus brunneus]
MAPSPRQPHRSPSHCARTFERVVSANVSHSKSQETVGTHDLDLRRRLPASYAAVVVKDTDVKDTFSDPQMPSGFSPKKIQRIQICGLFDFSLRIYTRIPASRALIDLVSCKTV